MFKAQHAHSAKQQVVAVHEHGDVVIRNQNAHIEEQATTIASLRVELQVLQDKDNSE